MKKVCGENLEQRNKNLKQRLEQLALTKINLILKHIQPVDPLHEGPDSCNAIQHVLLSGLDKDIITYMLVAKEMREADGQNRDEFDQSVELIYNKLTG